MRGARVAVVIVAAIVAVAVPAAGSGSRELEFGLPGQVGGSLEGEGLKWLLVALDEESSMEWSLEDGDVRQALNRTLNWPLIVYGERHYAEAPPTQDAVEVAMADPASVAGRSANRPSSLYVEAESITVEAEDSRAAIRFMEDGACVRTTLGNEGLGESSPWSGYYCPEETGTLGVLTGEGASRRSGFKVHASQITRLVWYGFETRCPTMECPGGGGSWTQGQGLPGGFWAGNKTESAVFVDLAGGSLEASGSAALVAGGAKSVGFSVDGWARLPRAAQDGAVCASGCAVDANQTLSITGNFTLAALRPSGENGRMAATLSGSVVSARVDEAAIEASSLLKGSLLVAAGAGVALVAWMAKILGASLFTRPSGPEALKQERRRRLHSFIRENPGASFSELLRRTGIPSATLRHHLNTLKRADLITERPLRNTTRFFPKEARFAESWMPLAAFRDPALAALHALIAREGECAQKRVMELAQREFSWRRSTTQHRLKRLVECQAVQERTRGRFKLYLATPDSLASGFSGLLAPPAPGGTAWASVAA